MFVHPSLHDSGGWATIEAMAAAKPVICLALGGPAVQTTTATGVLVSTSSVTSSIREMAHAMTRLANSASTAMAMGEAAQNRIHHRFTWRGKADALSHLISSVGAKRAGEPVR